ncbi:MAG: GNAT family N-acetyltransferase [Solobacterium sp.]|nr:GNAT family N-acetyltransferase [Solobacterium sp.]
MVKLIKITESNLQYAISLQEAMFPGESARLNYEDGIYGRAPYDYYLIYDDEVCVGFIGLYQYPEDNESAWLGWFGILEEYRKHHYGTEALKMFEDLARSKNYKYARLYTDEADNDAAIAFYEYNGYTSEKYLNPEDPVCYKFPTLIFSKSLCDEPVPLWNNRSIHLTEQVEKQDAGQKISDSVSDGGIHK